MKTGEFRNTLDEKGRLLIPAKIRNEVAGNVLVLTKGVDKCLWMFTPDEWNKLSEKLLAASSFLKSKTRLLQRRIIAPAQECEIDRSGRINIPQTLREASRLSKDTVILAIEQYFEIWDEAEYAKYEAESEEDFLEAAEELGDLLS